MKNLIKSLFVGLCAVAFLSSCDKGETDYPNWGSYVTVSVAEKSYHFVSDEGEKVYPGDVSRIGSYNTKDKDGKRAFIYFNYLSQKVDGYEHNVALYNIVDILSKSVEVANDATAVEAAGDNTLKVESAQINDSWLDIAFLLYTEQGAKHKMTLLDNKTATAPTTLPEGYQYLEFRQNADGAQGQYLSKGYVSYKLSDDYNPAKTGSKGLYIRVNSITSGVKYIKVDYTAPKALTQRHTGSMQQEISVQ